jgi:negative regulator of flagellin synthesis FlgM
MQDEKRDTTMTDGISRSGPIGPGYTQPAKPRSAEARPAGAAATTEGDRVELSAGAQQLASEPGFDAAKVAQIKMAIATGNYPLDARRMAESFVSLEQMFDQATSGRTA